MCENERKRRKKCHFCPLLSVFLSLSLSSFTHFTHDVHALLLPQSSSSPATFLFACGFFFCAHAQKKKIHVKISSGRAVFLSFFSPSCLPIHIWLTEEDTKTAAKLLHAAVSQLFSSSPSFLGRFHMSGRGGRIFVLFYDTSSPSQYIYFFGEGGEGVGQNKGRRRRGRGRSWICCLPPVVAVINES